MADLKISELSDGSAPADADDFVVARSGSTLRLPWSALKNASGLFQTATTTTMSSASASDTTITIANQPSWVRVGERIVIDPHTSLCESAVIKTVSGTTVTLRAALANSHAANTLVYCPPNGVFNAAWWGAGIQTTGNEVPINAAATAAGTTPSGVAHVTAGTVYLPRGNYRTTETITLPQGVSLVGEGIYATTISVDSDLGSGVYAIQGEVVDFAQNTYADFALYGVGSNPTVGVAPCLMSGIRAGSNCFVDRVQTSLFWAGLDCQGNHSTVRDSLFNDGYYGVYFNASSAGFGDWIFDNVSLQSHGGACFGVHKDSSIDEGLFIKIGAGSAPFAFFKEGSGASTAGFVTNSIFQMLAGEGLGSAVFMDSNAGQGASSFGGWIFVGQSGFSWVSGWRNTSYDDCFMKIDKNAGIEIYGTGAKVNSSSTYWYSSFAGGAPYVHNMDKVLSYMSTTRSFSPNGQGATGTWSGQSGSGITQKLASSTAVAVGQLLMRTGQNTSDLYSSGAPSGFALSAGTVSGDVVVVQEKGTVTGVPATGTVAAGNYLKPSATAGSVQAATGFSDGPIVGVALTGGTNTNITVGAKI